MDVEKVRPPPIRATVTCVHRHGLCDPDAASQSPPPRHRRDGPYGPDWPPPSFLRELWTDPRLISIFFVILPLLLWNLAEWTLDRGDVTGLALGASGMAAGLLALVSFALRFFPRLLWSRRWAASRVRRVVQAVLIWAWFVAFPLGLLAAVAAGLLGRG